MVSFLTICGAEKVLRGLSSTRKPAKCDNGREKRCETSTRSSPDLTLSHQNMPEQNRALAVKEKKPQNSAKTPDCGEIWHSSSDHPCRAAHPTRGVGGVRLQFCYQPEK